MASVWSFLALALLACVTQIQGRIDCKADIVFVLDSSGSMTPESWLRVKEFTRDMVAAMPVGPDDVRIGVVQYAQDAEVAFVLDQYSTSAEIQSQIMGLNHKTGLTATGTAINLARTDVFSQSGDRPAVHNIMMVLTDGNFNTGLPLLFATWLARADGIVLFAIGFGPSIDTAELDLIADDPTDDTTYSFHVGDANALQTLLETIIQNACLETPLQCNELSNITLFDPSRAVIDIKIAGDVKCRAMLITRCIAVTTTTCVPSGADIATVTRDPGGDAAIEITTTKGGNITVVKFDCPRTPGRGPCYPDYLTKFGNDRGKYPRLSSCHMTNEACLWPTLGDNVELFKCPKVACATPTHTLTDGQECWARASMTADVLWVGQPLVYIERSFHNTAFLYGFVSAIQGPAVIVDLVASVAREIGCDCVPGCWLVDPADPSANYVNQVTTNFSAAPQCTVETWNGALPAPCGMHPPLCLKSVVIDNHPFTTAPDCSPRVDACGVECCDDDPTGCRCSDYGFKVKCPFNQ